MNDTKFMTPLHLRTKRVISACAVACVLGFSAPSSAVEQLVDRVSVLVNDTAITEAELRLAIAQLRAQNTQASNEQLRKLATEELIMLTLQEQQAKQRGLSVDDATLDRAMQTLAQQNNLSLTNFRKNVTSQGMSWNELRDSVRRQILLERVRESEVLRRINVSEQEIEDYLAEQDSGLGQPQYQLEHFVVPIAPNADQATKRKTEKAVNMLQVALADNLSSQQIVGAFRARRIPLEGGPLGWRNANDLPAPMNEIVPRLMTSESSEPVVDGQGVHILRLLAVRQAKADAVEQHHARHILLKLNPLRTAAQAKQELDALLRQVQGGEDFAKLAKEFSEDYASAVIGGDLGWAGPGAMVPAFENQMKLLSPGQLSQPFETAFGWHIIKLEDRRLAEASATERRKQARAEIAKTKRATTTQRWLQQLRDQAYLEYPNES